MKVIVCEAPDGTLHRYTPQTGARLISGYTYHGETVLLDQPEEVSIVLISAGITEEDLRHVELQWAETDDEFLNRIIDKDLPAGATKITKVSSASLPDKKYRDAWKIENGAVVIDADKAILIDNEIVRRKRAEEYPEIGDQLDAIWKQLKVMSDGGQPLEAEAQIILDKILFVKNKHKKNHKVRIKG